MTGADRSGQWADTSFLREVQYKTDVNLAARQSIYAYQQPPVDLVGRALSLAAPDGSEVVADIGCGNGLYLAELARRGHAGPVLGADISVPLMYERISLDQGEVLLRSEFASVTRHDFVSKLLLPGPEPVAAYVRSMLETTRRADPEPLIAAVTSRLPPVNGPIFQVTTHSGCLVCA